MKTLITLVLPFFLFACSKHSDITDTTGNTGNSAPGTNPEPSYLWPLKQDNQWNYKAVIYQANEVDTSSTYDFSIKLQTPMNLNGHMYYTYYDSIEQRPAVIRNVDTTAVEMGYETGPYQTFYKKVKNDPEVLRSRTEVSPMDISFTYMTIAYPGTTAVDSFQNCIRTDDLVLDSNSGDTLQRDVYYLKPEIGFVQSTRYGKNQSTGAMQRVSRVQLTSYQLY